MGLIETHCVSCHAAYPTDKTFSVPPKNVRLETIEDVRRFADLIKAQTVSSYAMPLGNMTEMTESERELLGAWLADQEAENITVIPDGNGEFTDGMGMLVDKDDLGFGKRSWRYSMLVKDGVVDKMFIEPQKPGDPFEVSDADTMLAAIRKRYAAAA